MQSIRQASLALGQIGRDFENVNEGRRKFTHSLFMVEDFKKDEVFNHQNVQSIRSAYGLAPKYIEEILGKRAL